MGVEINEWGRPVAYHFLTYHPATSVPAATCASAHPCSADQILHLYAAERPGQTGALPACIVRLNNLKGYEEAEIIAARASNAMMGFVRTPDQNWRRRHGDQSS